MSGAEHKPDGLDHHVYLLEADGVPFYVGKGRAARAADRVNWARKQRVKRLRGEAAKLELHQEILLLLQDAGHLVTVRYITENLSDGDSRLIEARMSAALRDAGFTLANNDGASRGMTLDQLQKEIKLKIESGRAYRMDPHA